MVNSRTEAIQQIQTLMAQYQLSPSDLKSLAPENSEHQQSLLQRILIYIGGAFIFVGLCVYINMIWEDLPSLARVIISLGSGFVAFILGLICLGDKRYFKVSTPLFLMAAFLQPFGLFVFMDEYLPHSNEIAKAASFVFAFMTLQQTIAFWASNRTSLLLFSVFFFYATIISILNWFDFSGREIPLLVGLSGLMVSWGIAQTAHKPIASFGYFVSSILTAVASWDILEDTPYDVLLIGVSAGLIYLAVFTASRTVLTVGVLSLLAFLGYFTDEYFANVVGWPIALIVMGFIMIGISIYAVKLGRKITS